MQVYVYYENTPNNSRSKILRIENVVDLVREECYRYEANIRFSTLSCSKIGAHSHSNTQPDLEVGGGNFAAT